MKGMEKFIESKEMLEYLTEQLRDTPLGWCNIIAASRASIEDKITALTELSEKVQPDKLRNPKKMAENAIKAIELTKNTLTGSVFILEEGWRTDDWNGHIEATPFAKFEQALKYIKNVESEDGFYAVGYPDKRWFHITRWDLNEHGILTETITWHLSADGVIWGFGFEDWSIRANRYLDAFDLILDLNYRVPYKAGEIVLVDMSPFTAPFPAVIADPEREGCTDCCQPQVLYINEHSKIYGGALKHLGKYPRFSALFRLARYKSPLEGKYAPLQIISGIIKKNPENGRLLIDKIDPIGNRNNLYKGVSWSVMQKWELIRNAQSNEGKKQV